MYRIAICDDEQELTDYLSKRISEEFGSRDMEFSISYFSSGREFLNAHNLDRFLVVFLDIKMPDMDGFDIATELHKSDNNTFIIFVTTESMLVYDSFKFRPFDFVPKAAPPDEDGGISREFFDERLTNAITRLIEQLSVTKPICLPLPYNQNVTVNAIDIQMMQSVRNYTEYIIKGHKPVRTRTKLDDAESELDGNFFARCHKSYIVNMKYIKNIDGHNMTITLKDGMIIPISKTRKQDFETAYINFLSKFGR